MSEKQVNKSGSKGNNNKNKGSYKSGQRYQRHSDEAKLPVEDDDQAAVDMDSPIIQSFLRFQTELDAKHDKYERLVKLGRDVTIESKRIIFLLHRVKRDDEDSTLISDAEKRLRDLKIGLLNNIARELVNEEPHQYLRAYTSGIQEFVEAITFYYYEKEKRLVSLEEILAYLEENEAESISNITPERPEVICRMNQLIQPTDYVLGIADLTGELMRKCIMAIGIGQVQMPFELCSFLRKIHDGFVSVGNQGPREISRKLFTLKQSLAKVETACYTIQVRGSEIPKHMLVDVFTRNSQEYQREELDPLYD